MESLSPEMGNVIMRGTTKKTKPLRHIEPLSNFQCHPVGSTTFLLITINNDLQQSTDFFLFSNRFATKWWNQINANRLIYLLALYSVHSIHLFKWCWLICVHVTSLNYILTLININSVHQIYFLIAFKPMKKFVSFC